MLRHLRLVVANGRSVDMEAAGILPVRQGTDLDLSTSLWNLLQVPEGRREDFELETSGMEASNKQLDAQLRQIDSLAMQHYPEDEAKRNAYKVVLLEQRLREYDYRFTGLRVKEM